MVFRFSPNGSNIWAATVWGDSYRVSGNHLYADKGGTVVAIFYLKDGDVEITGVSGKITVSAPLTTANV